MESFFDWRNRLIASPSFQRWATRFPLTRWVVKKQASEIFDLMAGFVYTQVLLACTQVSLFDILSKGALSFEGYIVINFDGVICDYTFAAANIDERDVLQSHILTI